MADLRAIAPVLRPDDLAEAKTAGAKVRHLLTNLYLNSLMSRAAFVDGEIAAVWGCGGALAGITAEPWLFTASVIERVPLAFFRVAREQVADMLQNHHALETGCLKNYSRSLRFWKMVGFEAVSEYEFGGRTFVKLRLERA